MSDQAKPDKGPILLLSQTFGGWLEENNCSVGLTTYQAGRLFLIGRKPDGSIRAHERLLEQCQGLWTDGQSLWTSGMHAIWRFENEIPPGKTAANGVDRRFVPREGRITGRIDCHDIGMTEIDGKPTPVFVNMIVARWADVEVAHELLTDVRVSARFALLPHIGRDLETFSAGLSCLLFFTEPGHRRTM